MSATLSRKIGRIPLQSTEIVDPETGASYRCLLYPTRELQQSAAETITGVWRARRKERKRKAR
jgi:hypothetical protein